MSATLWFNTRSNSVLRHALTDDSRAACNSRIRPVMRPVYAGDTVVNHQHNGKPEGSLPEYAELCPQCRQLTEVATRANQDKFIDWDDTGTELELTDNADSISITTRMSGDFGSVELDVRIRPEDLDRLMHRIRVIRQNRGI